MNACFECDRPAEHDHHVVPRSKGGTRTVPLCEECHGKVHETNMKISSLTKMGLERARAAGVEFGAPSAERLAPDAVRLVRELYATGKYSHRSLADKLNADGVATAKGAGRWWPKTVASALRGSASDPAS